MEANRFKVIDGGAPAKPAHKPGAKRVWQCRVCPDHSRYMT